MDSVGGYKKEGNLGGARHGDAYQVHVLMLLYERAVSDCYGRYADFRLATEMKAAGKFDDAVLAWADEGDGEWKWLFVQVKHKLMSVKLEGKHLFPDLDSDKGKGDFSLFKYLESFWEIKHLGEFDGNKQFVIYTNCGMSKSLQDWFTDASTEIEPILKSGLSDERFLKLLPKDEHCENLLKYANNDFVKLVDKVLSFFTDDNAVTDLELIKRYRGAISCKILITEGDIVKFAPRFTNRNKLTHAERIFRDQLTELGDFSSCYTRNEDLSTILSSKAKSINTLPPLVSEKEVKEFLNSLIFAIHQPDNVSLKQIIIKELQMRQTSPVPGPSSDNHYALLAYSTLHNKIHVCLDSTAVQCMSLRRKDLEIEFQTIQRTISSSRLSVQSDLFRGEMQNLRVEFSNPMIPTSADYPGVIVTSTQKGLLNSLKVYQVLQSQNLLYFSLKDLQNQSIRLELCDALRDPKSNFYLLLKDDGIKFEFASEILEAISEEQAKKMYFLTNSAESAKRFFAEKNFALLEKEDILLSQLIKPDQQKIINKTVIFQGVEVHLRALADHAILGKLISNEVLEKLVQDEFVTIGPPLPELGIDYYIPRIITRSDTDELANETDKIPPNLADTLGNGTEENCSYSEEQFLDFPFFHGTRDVVVLSSTPGMGKTTLWIRLALLAKIQFRTQWVFYAKLQHCEKYARTGKVLDFLADHFKLSDLDISLVQYCIEQLKHVYIFFDGFDELPFASTGPIIILLRQLQRQNVQIFVNTRTRLQVELEGAFNVKAFFLKPISKNEQTILFKSFCNFIEESELRSRPFLDFVQRLMDRIHSKPMKIASKFVGVPLMVPMLAEIYKPSIKHYQETKNPDILGQINLESLDIMGLFEQFVYTSFQRQNIVKQNLSVDNYHTQRMLNKDNILYRGFVKLHSLLGLMSLVKGKKMHLIVRDKWELQTLQQQIPLLDSPIVTSVPNFIHGSIAEFFAAKCLFSYLNRMEHEDVMSSFKKNVKTRRAPKKHYVKNVFDIYYHVLRDYPTVRKFFFVIARQQADCLDKLEVLMWSMRPYPLMWACEENFEELAKRLIQEDAKIIHSKVRNSETALHCAAAQDHEQICALLINNGLSIEALNNRQQTALHTAAVNGCYEVASLLIVRGANVDAVDNQEQTPLFLAAQGGYVNVVRLLINQGCDLNKLNARKWNALHIAAFNNHIDVVRVLLARKVKMKVGEAKKWLMFIGYLVSRKYFDVIRLLVGYETRGPKSSTNETLFWAIRRGHYCIVQTIHQVGGSIYEIEERSGLCSYQIALNNSSYTIAELILAVQKRIDMIEYPLHAAARAGSTGCISILLERNAEVNAKDQNGQTPLDLALKECHVGVVYLLLEKHATIGKTMLHATVRANKANCLMCLQALILFGADVNAVDDRYGRTPLHDAVIFGKHQCASLLLKAGASVDAEDKHSLTPFQYARKLRLSPEKPQPSVLKHKIGMEQSDSMK